MGEKSRDRGIYGVWCFYIEWMKARFCFKRRGVRPDIFKSYLAKSRVKRQSKATFERGKMAPGRKSREDDCEPGRGKRILGCQAICGKTKTGDIAKTAVKNGQDDWTETGARGTM